MRSTIRTGALALLLVAGTSAPSARAFTAFHASTARPRIQTDATTVVILREGEHTVVSLRPSYRGPARDFAVVVPVPPDVELASVRTLRPDALDRIERLGAPSLVELWERDPCAAPRAPTEPGAQGGGRAGRARAAVTADAGFAADGYEVAILRLSDAAALTRWLRERGYRVPPGAARAARPYVAAGYRFLVARVGASRLAFERGRARLPPLRFHYRSDQLVLPLRFGLVGAQRTQDLAIHVLARERYVAANRPNVLAPTELEMYPRARDLFDEVYATIFARVLARHPGAAVTELSRPAARCPGCPARPLSPSDLDAFGRDVLGAGAIDDDAFVLTRLRLRLEEPPDADLLLRPAPPIGPGRPRAQRPRRQPRRRPTTNGFRTRFFIRHRWDRPIACASPVRDRWAGRGGRGLAPSLSAAITTDTIRTGRLRRYLHTWTPVLRIPSRADAPSADGP